MTEDPRHQWHACQSALILLCCGTNKLGVAIHDPDLDSQAKLQPMQDSAVKCDCLSSDIDSGRLQETPRQGGAQCNFIDASRLWAGMPWVLRVRHCRFSAALKQD